MRHLRVTFDQPEWDALCAAAEARATEPRQALREAVKAGIRVLLGGGTVGSEASTAGADGLRAELERAQDELKAREKELERLREELRDLHDLAALRDIFEPPHKEAA